jgi:hypothetical protein
LIGAVVHSIHKSVEVIRPVASQSLFFEVCYPNEAIASVPEATKASIVTRVAERTPTRAPCLSFFFGTGRKHFSQAWLCSEYGSFDLSFHHSRLHQGSWMCAVRSVGGLCPPTCLHGLPKSSHWLLRPERIPWMILRRRRQRHCC